MKTHPNVCPECDHVFQGNGWDGIDAHWRAKHEKLMPYEKAWPLIQSGDYKRKVKSSSSSRSVMKMKGGSSMKDSRPENPPETASMASGKRQVFLIGRPPLTEFLGFMNQSVDAATQDIGRLADEWRTANDHIRDLEKCEGGLADNPKIGTLDPQFEANITALRSNPAVKKSYEIVPFDFGVVELDKLVVFQKHIDLDFVDFLKKKLGSKPTDKDVFDLCFPIDEPLPNIEIRQSQRGGFVLSSPSTDFRLLDIVRLEANEVTRYVPGGRLSYVLGLALGFSVNFLSALSVENRLILNNASHRAFALRDSGITHAPCLIQKISRREELEIAPLVNQNTDLYLKSTRPPLLKDYFDEQLRKIIITFQPVHQFKASFGWEPV